MIEEFIKKKEPHLLIYLKPQVRLTHFHPLFDSLWPNKQFFVNIIMFKKFSFSHILHTLMIKHIKNNPCVTPPCLTLILFLSAIIHSINEFCIFICFAVSRRLTCSTDNSILEACLKSHPPEGIEELRALVEVSHWKWALGSQF